MTRATSRACVTGKTRSDRVVFWVLVAIHTVVPAGLLLWGLSDVVLTQGWGAAAVLLSRIAWYGLLLGAGAAVLLVTVGLLLFFGDPGQLPRPRVRSDTGKEEKRRPCGISNGAGA